MVEVHICTRLAATMEMSKQSSHRHRKGGRGGWTPTKTLMCHRGQTFSYSNKPYPCFSAQIAPLNLTIFLGDHAPKSPQNCIYIHSVCSPHPPHTLCGYMHLWMTYIWLSFAYASRITCCLRGYKHLRVCTFTSPTCVCVSHRCLVHIEIMYTYYICTRLAATMEMTYTYATWYAAIQGYVTLDCWWLMFLQSYTAKGWLNWAIMVKR